MSDHPERANGLVNPSVKYEHSDLSLRAVLIFSAALVGVLIAVSVGLYFIIPAYLGPTPQQAPLTSNENGPWKGWNEVSETAPPLHDSRLSPPPELEAIDRTAPPAEGGGTHTRPIEEQLREEEAELNGYGWVNPDKKIVHIPIEEAMRRMAAGLGGKP